VGSVANRYSKALFQAALEQNKVDRIAEDSEMLQALINSNPELRDLLLNPLIPYRKRIDLLTQLFKDKVDSLTFDFIMLISAKKRTAFLGEITQNFADRVLTHKGIMPGVIRSATKLSESQRREIEKKVEDMTGKNIVFTEEIDSDLVGGFVIRVKDTVIDLSIKGQLEKLKQKLIHG